MEATDLKFKRDFSGHQRPLVGKLLKKFVENNWVVGYDDGLFRPDRLVTRAEFTAMVVNIFKEEKEVEGNNFKDVNKDDWFYNAVSYAASEGLIAGYEDGTFRPM